MSRSSAASPWPRRLQNWLRERARSILALGMVLGLVCWAHLGSGAAVFTASVHEEAGWPTFRERYGVREFGEDGYFVRAVRHGFNLFYYTERYAWRFSRREAGDPQNRCASCHQVEQLAYAFVNADREDPAAHRRISFEERVMRCYVGKLDGFVPTIYDPAVRDLRILARMVARHLDLAEGDIYQGE